MVILVSGASGVVGYGIAKSLRKSSNQYKIIGTTIYDFSVAPAFCDVVEKILPTDHSGYMKNLCEIIEKHKVVMAIPSIECDVYRWNEERESLQAITFPLLNNEHLIDLCFDKWYFYEKLIAGDPRYAISTVRGVNFDAFPFPFLLKPRHGYGSKGIIKIRNKSDMKSHLEEDKINFMTQPIIGADDEEYTVSGFFDEESNLIDYFPLKRKLSSGGFTEQAEVVDRNFGEALTDLAKIFKPVGPTNFQFRMDGDQPKLLEINPRISSATSIRAELGYNEAEMSVNYFLRGILPEVREKPIGRKAIRYTEDYIF